MGLFKRVEEDGRELIARLVEQGKTDVDKAEADFKVAEDHLSALVKAQYGALKAQALALQSEAGRLRQKFEHYLG